MFPYDCLSYNSSSITYTTYLVPIFMNDNTSEFLQISIQLYDLTH